MTRVVNFLLKLWHRFTLGRTARRRGIVVATTCEYRKTGFRPGMTYTLEFMPGESMVIGFDTYLARRKATDLPAGVVRIVLETCE